MATYAIGDIQGCFTALKKLLDQIRFNPARDRLWFVGDLVNRGSESLSVLRYVKSLGQVATTVLGNHDIHLLAVAGGVGKLHRRDTIQDILETPDREELLFWLRHQPMIHRESGFVLVHAGLLPEWSVDKALTLAQEVEQALRSEHYQHLLMPLYRSTECRWKDDHPSPYRLGAITNVLTRLRVCSAEGEMDLSYKGPPDEAPPGLLPWYKIPPIHNRDETIVFGHWSNLGIIIDEKLLGLDGGCVWGKELVAIRLDDRERFHVSCGE